jgi:starvation-inducible DNA-binding protein
MYESPSPLSPDARAAVADALNARLADALDLHGQIKVAHWNVRGPHFAALHPLFESFAVALAAHGDAIAERAVALGALARGTARHVAAHSTLPDYPQDTTSGLRHVALLADRFEAFLRVLRDAREVAERHGDTDTVDLLTQVVTDFEKNAWFLRASLAE